MRTYLALLLVGLGGFLGCSKSGNGDGGVPDAGPIPAGAGVGQRCQALSDCRTGLACVNKLCAPSGAVIEGGSCILSAECVAGNYCTQLGSCAASGKLPVGSTCSSEGDCATGLACVESGLTGVCQVGGVGDLGRTCLTQADCMAGLLCVRGQCTKGALAAKPLLACPTLPEQTAKVYFRVPRATDPKVNMDFYQLPFPNDIRVQNGKVDLTGHPTPGATMLDFDLVQRYVTAASTELGSFGANQAMYLRLSKPFDLTNFPGDCGGLLVDITPTSPTYGTNLGFTCNATNGSATYICGPYVVFRPTLGSPLRPGTTYALLIKKTLVDGFGTPFGPDDDFTAMLAPTAPAAPSELAAAYPAYQPLRDYIAAGKVAAAELASALVFTVQPYEAPMADIATGVAVAPAPVVESLVRCDDPLAVSPCQPGCLPADAASATYTTYQGTLSLPVFQKGVRPYLDPSTGGSVEYDASGVALVQGAESVCFSLTVPKGVMPATGWPLVVYGHGTGGSYRSIVDLALADDFALGTVPAGVGGGVDGGAIDGGAAATAVPMAVLGFDGVMHGTRKGGSTKPVGELVYNFLNPAAARDNVLQAAADLLAIPRALPSFAAKGLLLDPSRVLLYGHSQGGNAAALVAARPSPYGTIVMSGTGGELIFTLLGKQSPINIPALLPVLLGEAGPVDANHPALNLMQMYFERSDSVNFGRRLFKEPVADMTPHHILHVYGTGDTYSVPLTQQAYALAAQFKVGGTMLDTFGLDPETKAPPFSNNEFFGRVGRLTAIELQYAPTPKGAYDGHFVSTQNASARAAIQQMLVTAARDGVPTVSP